MPTCSICHQSDHNARTCPTKKQPTIVPSTSSQPDLVFNDDLLFDNPSSPDEDYLRNQADLIGDEFEATIDSERMQRAQLERDELRVQREIADELDDFNFNDSFDASKNRIQLRKWSM